MTKDKDAGGRLGAGELAEPRVEVAAVFPVCRQCLCNLPQGLSLPRIHFQICINS